jgi:hypothetical protein
MSTIKSLCNKQSDDDRYAIKSLIEKYDIEGNGVISEEEMNVIERIIELEARKAKEADRDKREDAQRKMTWFALFGMLLYPLGIICTDALGLERASDLLSSIAPTYFVAIAGLVAAFFGSQAFARRNNDN